MDAAPPPPLRTNGRKRRRKSRFAPLEPEPAPPTRQETQPPASNGAISEPDAPPLNPHVVALRKRLADRLNAAKQKQAQLDQAQKQAPTFEAPPPPKRRRRFSATPPPNIPESAAKPASLNLTPKLDVTQIPMAPVSTLRINRAAAQTRKLSNILRTSKADLLETDPDKNPYHDVSLHMNPEKKRRPKRELEFVIPGEIARMAERRREKAEVAARDEGYRKELREAAQRCDEIPVLPPYRAIGGAGRGEEGVDVEWWDAPFVQRDKEGKVITDVRDGLEGYVLRDERITQYVHHPASIQPAVIKSVPEVKLMLTKEERKKLRRQKREEAHKEQTDMIAAGLMPPPAPKVRLGNLVRVLANEATADPTAVEKRVREQVAERRRKHLEANEMRKRTPAEKMEKVREKHQKDREGGLMANVYRMDVEVQARHRYKVDVNARQSGISGCLVVCEGGWNVVVVEGGAKALRKYNRLMLRRIDWTGEKRDEGDGDGDGEKAGCVLVWQGSISSAAFEGFSTLSVRNEGGARSHFRKHQVEHYWDLCTQATPTGNTSLGVRQAI